MQERRDCNFLQSLDDQREYLLDSVRCYIVVDKLTHFIAHTFVNKVCDRMGCYLDLT